MIRSTALWLLFFFSVSAAYEVTLNPASNFTLEFQNGINSGDSSLIFNLQDGIYDGIRASALGPIVGSTTYPQSLSLIGSGSGTILNNCSLEFQFFSQFNIRNVVARNGAYANSRGAFWGRNINSMVVESSSFNNVSVGVFFTINMGRISVTGSTFNASTNQALWISAQNMTLTTSTFTNCYTGAGFYSTMNGEVTGCTFENNNFGLRVDGSGKFPVNKVDRCTFRFNKQGIAAPDMFITEVTNCGFLQNEVAFEGDRGTGYGSKLTIRNCIINDNTAGAVQLDGIETEISNCEFKRNQCIGIFNSKGGAIYSQSNTPIVRNSVFEENSCGSGGAIYFYLTSANPPAGVSNCTFNRNVALDGTSGGGGAIFSQTYLVVNSSRFINNVALYTNGGAILADSNEIQLRDSFLSNNTAKQYCALYFGSSYLQNVTVVDTNCTGKILMGSGYGIYADRLNVYGNIADVVASAVNNLTNSNLFNNVARVQVSFGTFSSGSLIYVVNSQVGHVIIQGGLFNAIGSNFTTIYPGGNGRDARFVSCRITTNITSDSNSRLLLLELNSTYIKGGFENVRLTTLQRLYAHDSDLDGDATRLLRDNSVLFWMIVRNSKIRGTLPTFTRDVRQLDLSGNFLDGVIPNIPTTVTDLDLGDNFFTGVDGSQSSNLKTCDMSENLMYNASAYPSWAEVNCSATFVNLTRTYSVQSTRHVFLEGIGLSSIYFQLSGVQVGQSSCQVLESNDTSIKCSLSSTVQGSNVDSSLIFTKRGKSVSVPFKVAVDFLSTDPTSSSTSSLASTDSATDSTSDDGSSNTSNTSNAPNEFPNSISVQSGSESGNNQNGNQVKTSKPVLGLPAIIGIAVGGGVALIAIVVVIIVVVVKKAGAGASSELAMRSF